MLLRSLASTPVAIMSERSSCRERGRERSWIALLVEGKRIDFARGLCRESERGSVTNARIMMSFQWSRGCGSTLTIM